MKVGFIGCGNMGGALARAVLRVLKTNIYISDHDAQKSAAFGKETGASVSDNNSIARECDFIFLAIKPNVFSKALTPLKNAFAENKDSVIVTMAAGLSLEKVGAIVGEKHPIIRIMPNTPAALGEGMIIWCANEFVTDGKKMEFETLLSSAGTLDRIDEGLIDAASAISGCGPAFVYMFIEALADGAVQCGLPRDKAILYAAQTLSGAAEMVTQTGKHPGLLKDEVCSPGGSTIEGVHVLEQGAFRAAVSGAVLAAFDKTKKLGK